MAKEKPTTKICKHCATEIPYNAKICPNCRKKQKKGCLMPVLAILGILVLFGVIVGLMGGSDSSTSSASTSSKKADTKAVETRSPEEYTSVSVKEMMDDLSANALKAQTKYKDQYLEITGILSTIDSDGKYISLHADKYSIIGVHCNIKNDTQRAQVANMSSGDTVTLRGKCKDMGEVMGYKLDIDSIDGYDNASAELQFPTSSDGYIMVTADDLVDIMDKNALAAQNAFKGKKLAITGKLGTIDSDGKYICLDSSKDFDFTNIQCYLKSEDQKAKITEMNKGDTLTVKGKCKDVGELLGYSLDIESIE